MWEYELFLKYLNDSIKEENDRQEKEMGKYKIDDYKKLSNPSKFGKNISQPKLPSMPSMKF